MIGLVTPTKVLNYGTKLQAYAMQELIGSLGFPVEVLNYEFQYDLRPHVVAKKLFSISKTKERIAQRLTRLRYKRIPGLQKRIHARATLISQFDQLLRRSPEIRGFETLKQHARKYSAVVCGSDQIWLPVNMHAEYFTLEFAPEKVRRVAYAPSFGISEVPPGIANRYTRFLSRMHHISVREEAGRKIIQSLMGKDVPVVLDPTLTIDSQRWVSLAATSTVKRPDGYIFCYFLGSNPEHRETAARLGRELGLKVVGLPHLEEFIPADDTYADQALYEVGPVDFIHLIQNASLVCTDSFHGTAFSVIFRKRFITFERYRPDSQKSTNSRIYSLLDKLELRHRLATDFASARAIASVEPNHDNTCLRLNALKQVSHQYLQSALDHLD
jgi:hypothetical protein